jgi:hypothetical protein
MYFTTHSLRDDPIVSSKHDPNKPKGLNKTYIKLRDVLV